MNTHTKQFSHTDGNRSGDFPIDRLVDVAVIGGGPAGTSTAIALAGYGRSVTILERSYYESTRIGETLPPEVREPLIELGLWEEFLADEPLESPGIVAAWGQPELYDNDFIVNPHGPGWHVDRCRFDALLAHCAAQSGVEVLCGAQRLSLAHDSASGWYLNARVDGQQFVRRATLLVDASGRFASTAKRLNGHRTVYDRLVGLVGFLSSSRPTGDRRTLVEAIECGWWYAAPLPDSRHIAAFMTDADLVPRRLTARAAFWHDQLQNAHHVKARLGRHATCQQLRVVSACSSRSRIIAGDDWITVGDAAAAFDPLSSQGVTWAMASGLAAANALDSHLRGRRHAMPEYARRVEAEFAHYLQTRADYYGREHRWPSSPFWQRRNMTASVIDHRSLKKVENHENPRKENRPQSYFYL